MAQTRARSNSKILIADDQPANVQLLELILDSAGYHNFISVVDSRLILPVCLDQYPDLILLDWHMPHVDGLTVLRELMITFPDDVYLPVLVVTADVTAETKRQALAAGAKDFLSKPLDASEVLLRISNLLETRELYQRIAAQNQTLEEKVRDRTQQLAEAQVEILRRLAHAAEYRDDGTGQHTQRVGSLAATLARALGQRNEDVELLRLAAPLHDVGKIGIPDCVMLKPGRLTAEEMRIMQSHTTIGGEILGRSGFAVLHLAREIALSHHERWDGSGYPQGTAGNRIPITGRITAIVDVFDALIHARPYKDAWPFDKALQYINGECGRQFDPELAQVFLQAIHVDGFSRLAEQLHFDGQEQPGISPAFVESIR